jgi:hypothetical protein
MSSNIDYSIIENITYRIKYSNYKIINDNLFTHLYIVPPSLKNSISEYDNYNMALPRNYNGPLAIIAEIPLILIKNTKMSYINLMEFVYNSLKNGYYTIIEDDIFGTSELNAKVFIS